jgi:hypothetical protein
MLKTLDGIQRKKPVCFIGLLYACLLVCLVVVFFPTIKRSRGELTLDFHDLVLAVVLGIAALVTPAFIYRITSPMSSIELEHENMETA